MDKFIDVKLTVQERDFLRDLVDGFSVVSDGYASELFSPGISKMIVLLLEKLDSI